MPKDPEKKKKKIPLPPPGMIAEILRNRKNTKYVPSQTVGGMGVTGRYAKGGSVAGSNTNLVKPGKKGAWGGLGIVLPDKAAGAAQKTKKTKGGSAPAGGGTPPGGQPPGGGGGNGGGQPPKEQKTKPGWGPGTPDKPHSGPPGQGYEKGGPAVEKPMGGGGGAGGGNKGQSAKKPKQKTKQTRRSTRRRTTGGPSGRPRRGGVQEF